MAPRKKASAMARVIDLEEGRRLVLTREGNSDRITVTGPDGGVRLTITLTDRGPVLHLEGACITIETDGDLSISAGSLALNARDGISLSTGGDAAVKVEGDLSIRARTHTIEAELGDVNVRANDDVRIEGERILMNC
ncbi:MAG TPA: hypothetical protein PLS81_10950 [Deltaproteobacteria bacterium]|nr:hypothetical protein [Deltaproteobacteria bacterium]HOM29959.1 hypothetical protein [Deltaproteobacteria bacterium]